MSADFDGWVEAAVAITERDHALSPATFQAFAVLTTIVAEYTAAMEARITAFEARVDAVQARLDAAEPQLDLPHFGAVRANLAEIQGNLAASEFELITGPIAQLAILQAQSAEELATQLTALKITLNGWIVEIEAHLEESESRVETNSVSAEHY
ncbi:hypothetical protein N7495_004962 [Penicillium taxi]|uniref:uncharacterized protein n=1 Tax=Penicillium taxi TaxID=168475 RepID=UPI002545324B|nr:uncharacterized protein N7495_004962 [Penicillium taxi]KAJ5893271.1 hypothetical protein N7495_004962 [Penicillium taxi]